MKLYGEYRPKDIKVIVFDFDETMYYSPNINQTYQKYILQVVQDLTKKSKEESYELLNKFGFMSNGEKRISFGKNCEKFGVTKQQWNEYRIDKFFEIDYDLASVVDNELYRKLAEKYILVIVSNEIMENLLIKANKLNIQLHNFCKIYSPNKTNVLNYKSDKTEAFRQICADFDCKSDEIFAIGDRYSVDIEPLINIGGNGLLVENTKEIEEFFK